MRLSQIREIHLRFHPLVERTGKVYILERRPTQLQRTEPMNANEKAVADALAKYQDALNQSDTNAVMRLYATDGVFMPQNSPSSVGTDAIRKAYDAVFKAIKLTVKFDVAEVVEMAPD